VTSLAINQLLNRLDKAKRQFDVNSNKTIERLLSRLARRTFTDPEELIRFHEILLFLCAYPQSARVRHRAESLLKSF
jgi:hypothetical protein